MLEHKDHCVADQYDYRLSHIGKGQAYDDSFRENPWRVFLWQREQQILDCILNKYFSDGTITHLGFACGTGRILAYLVGRTETSTGIDVSESMLKVAREKVPSAEVIKGDLTKNDILGDRLFNLITAFRFFPNAQPPLRAEAIQCLVKHLTPNGLLVLNNHKNHSSLLYRLARLVGRHHRTMKTKEVEQLVSSVGLKVAEVFPIGVLPACDKHPMILPSFIHKCADWFANACAVGRTLCQDIIYVCRLEGQTRLENSSQNAHAE